VRLVIAEDEVLLRQGLTHLLEHAGHTVVATASDAEELLRVVAEQQPELVIADIRMPPSHSDEGLVAAVQIRRDHPEVAVLLLSQHLQRRYALELLKRSPSGVGYLLKQRVADVDTFCADVERVAGGGTVLDPEVVALMVSRARQGHETVGRLTARQLEVLALMARGLSNSAIARELHISEKVVVAHVSHIYHQFGLPVSEDDHRRVLAVLRYLSS
jgi:DNA-binding NarL/FixJ family response regulator